MSSVRSKDTKPELIVRKSLHAHGFRYRIHVKTLLGKPDIVLAKHKTIVFVNGCFWHGHTHCHCNLFRLPKTNMEYWISKIQYNQIRHKKNVLGLRKLGWTVITVWECQLISTKRQNCLNKIIKKISQVKTKRIVHKK